MTQGTLFIIAAPSGGGKTSLVQNLIASTDQLKMSISYTTRDQRPGEEEGQHYFFVTEAKFNEMAQAGDFLEQAKVFGHYYGTAKAWVTETLATGTDVILEIDWQGARQIRAQFENSVGIFILPPTLDSLEQRLRRRGRDIDAVIDARMAKARQEISHCEEFDFWVINDDFTKASEDLAAIIRAHRLRHLYQREKLQGLTTTLMHHTNHDDVCATTSETKK